MILFDFKLCTEDWGVLKPHQRAFDGIIQTIRIQPSEILYVGNNVEYDILGAKKLECEQPCVEDKTQMQIFPFRIGKS